mgnify:CR=1 FL=1
MTNPPDDARIWHALDDLADLGWVTLAEYLGDPGEPAYSITQRGQYWLRQWADRQAQRKQEMKSDAQP